MGVQCSVFSVCGLWLSGLVDALNIFNHRFKSFFTHLMKSTRHSTPSQFTVSFGFLIFFFFFPSSLRFLYFQNKWNLLTEHCLCLPNAECRTPYQQIVMFLLSVFLLFNLHGFNYQFKNIFFFFSFTMVS